MRISDWSSDVCSSDLRRRAAPPDAALHVTATPPRPDLTRGRRDDPRPRDYHRSRDRGIRTWVYADPGSAGDEAPVRCELDRSALRVRRGGAHALLDRKSTRLNSSH